MSEERSYILGTDREELDRLRFQHTLWARQQVELLQRAGLRDGAHVLDLGCGPGFTSFELASMVGPGGSVIACDRSPRFVEWLRSELELRGLEQVTPLLAEVEDLDLAPASLDAVYARWLFCWLRDPGAVLAQVARALRPGGVAIVQDYVDWGAMKLIPPCVEFERVLAACMRSWAEGEGTIDIGDLLPTLAAECGLELELFEPVARMGAVGSLEWRWIGEFFTSYPLKLVEAGLLDQHEHAACLTAWSRRSEEGRSHCCTPTVVNAVLRRPAS